MIIKLNIIPTSYINLKKDIEKKNNVESILKDLQFKSIQRIDAMEPKIDKFVSERKNLGNIYGCSLSHSQALLLNKPPFIILEDDIEVLNFKNEIEIPDDADALYLGNMSWGLIDGYGQENKLIYEKVDGYDDIYKVYNLLGTHAILYLSERYIKKCWKSLTNSYRYKNLYIDDVNPDSIASDVSFAKIQPEYNVYTVGLPIFYQSGNYENNTNKHIEEYGALDNG